ncbi:MAG: sortase [Candidatus Pacebacteria bacterium]|nr:sortase [Candidatus Paceibacterota bacterium]
MEKTFTTSHTSQNAPVYAVDGFMNLLKQHPVVVGGAWFVVFAFLFAFSWVVGIVPELDPGVDEEVPVVAGTETVTDEEATDTLVSNDTPVRIIIDAINVDAKIMNPASRSIEALDAALMEGVVHYPGSGNLEDTSNMFLLGHSTGFRVVNNEAYKVFNGLKNLKENDVIRVQSEGNEYLYRVKHVGLVNAEETEINLRSSVKMLTLATCNVFGAKEERYVVSAEFVGSYPVAEEELDV